MSPRKRRCGRRARRRPGRRCGGGVCAARRGAGSVAMCGAAALAGGGVRAPFGAGRKKTPRLPRRVTTCSGWMRGKKKKEGKTWWGSCRVLARLFFRCLVSAPLRWMSSNRVESVASFGCFFSCACSSTLGAKKKLALWVELVDLGEIWALQELCGGHGRGMNLGLCNFYQ